MTFSIFYKYVEIKCQKSFIRALFLSDIHLLSLFKINAFWAPFTEKMRRGCSQPTLISTIEVSQCTSPQICTESSSRMGDGSVRDDIIGWSCVLCLCVAEILPCKKDEIFLMTTWGMTCSHIRLLILWYKQEQTSIYTLKTHIFGVKIYVVACDITRGHYCPNTYCMYTYICVDISSRQMLSYKSNIQQNTEYVIIA